MKACGKGYRILYPQAAPPGFKSSSLQTMIKSHFCNLRISEMCWVSKIRRLWVFRNQAKPNKKAHPNKIEVLYRGTHGACSIKCPHCGEDVTLPPVAFRMAR